MDNIWLNPDVYYSYDACEASIQDDSKLKYLKKTLNSMNYLFKTQCPRTDLSKRFLPKPMTTTG